MHLFPALRARYTREPFSAPEAQRRAELIAWSPVVFEVSRLMVKFGILSLLRDSDAGLTVEEIAEATSLSPYAVTVLTDASLSIGTILVDEATDRFSLSKTGWFLLTDEGTRVNLEFNHAVNYRGMFHLEEALREGRPPAWPPWAIGPPSTRDSPNCPTTCGIAGLPSTIIIATTRSMPRSTSSSRVPSTT